MSIVEATEQTADELDESPFYFECGCWPYVHSIVPASLIALEIYPTDDETVIILAAFVSIYGWESVEKLVSFLGISAYLAESAFDSLLGDVAVGGFSILNIWLVDQITHWDRGINRVTPYWLRLVAFVLIAAPSLVMGRFKADTECNYRWRYAVIFYGIYYIVLGGALFYGSAAASDDPVRAHHIVWRTSVWLGIVALLTASAAVIERGSSTFLQVLVIEAVIFLILLLILAITKSDER